MKLRYLIAILVAMVTSSIASANWTLNLGYRNPPNSRYGINFLYLGTKFGFELGIGAGSIDAGTTENDDDDDDDNLFVNAGGAVSLSPNRFALLASLAKGFRCDGLRCSLVA